MLQVLFESGYGVGIVHEWRTRINELIPNDGGLVYERFFVDSTMMANWSWSVAITGQVGVWSLKGRQNIILVLKK